MDESIVVVRSVGPTLNAKQHKELRDYCLTSHLHQTGGGYGSFGQILHATKAMKLKNQRSIVSNPAVRSSVVLRSNRSKTMKELVLPFRHTYPPEITVKEPYSANRYQ